jgi:hypothetical protein
MVATIVFATFLLLLAGGLFGLHHQHWRTVCRLQLAEAEVKFARQQYRRRVQVSGLLAAVALTMVGAHWLTSRLAALFVWTAVMFVVLWICILAMVDWWQTHRFYQQLRADHLAEQAALEAQLKQLFRYRNNGQPEKPGSSSGRTTGDGSDAEV